MKIPYVEIVPQPYLDGLIEMLGDPERFAAKLNQLLDLQKFINTKIDELGERKKVETLMSAADTKFINAQKAEADATQALEDARTKAKGVLDGADREATKIVGLAQNALQAARETEQSVSARERVAEKAIVDAREAKRLADEAATMAREQFEQSKKTEAEYRQKIAAIKAVTG